MNRLEYIQSLIARVKKAKGRNVGINLSMERLNIEAFGSQRSAPWPFDPTGSLSDCDALRERLLPKLMWSCGNDNNGRHWCRIALGPCLYNEYEVCADTLPLAYLLAILTALEAIEKRDGKGTK